MNQINTAMLDTLQNLVSGLGTSADKNQSNQWKLKLQSRSQWESAYRGDWVARKIVDIPPSDMTREWRVWNAEDEDLTKLQETEEEHLILQKVKEATVLARLYGGSAIVMGLDGTGSNESQLSIDRVGEGALQFVHVVHRFEINAQDIVRNPLDPFFNQPRVYEVSSDETGHMRVHPSRVVRFIGNPVPDRALRQDEIWGDSILMVLDDAIKQAGLSSEGVASLINEAKTDIVRIPDFSEQVSTEGYKSRIIERFQLAGIAKSLVNTLLLDKEEEWERQQINFAGLPDLIKVYLLVASGAADIPVTRMIGQSPSGLSATGESDIRNYYDRISSDQKTILQPTIRMLDRVIVASSLGSTPDEVKYSWRPLWQTDEKDKAEVVSKKATVFQVDLNAGLIPEAALAKARVNQLIEDDVYPGLEAEIEEAGGMDEFLKEKEEDDTENEEAMAALRAAGGLEPGGGDPAEGEGEEEEEGDDEEEEIIEDAASRTLFVSRPVINSDDIIAWAMSQGFETVVPAEELHVTLAHSREPVDWFLSGEAEEIVRVESGGPRLVERLGDQGAVVLLFASSTLSFRHEQIRRTGAKWDFPEFMPHITITMRPTSMTKPEEVVPYRGPIVLGPERFAEIGEGSRVDFEEIRPGEEQVQPG